jgi:hypothetical protein
VDDAAQRFREVFRLPLVRRIGGKAHEDGQDSERRHGKTIGNEIVTDHPYRLSRNRVCPGDLEHPRMRLLVPDDSRRDNRGEVSREAERADSTVGPVAPADGSRLRDILADVPSQDFVD